MPDPKVNQRRIAELLSLSTATVSRSLRNDSSINPTTRARVLEAASRLGYRPRSASRGARRSGPDMDTVPTIGVLIGHPGGFRDDPSSAGQSMLAGISDASNANDLCLSVHFVSPEDALQLDDPDTWPPALRSGLVAGLILLYPFPHEVVEKLAAHWPCVAVSPPDPTLPTDFVDVDEVNAVADLVDHLHDLGHTRIGFLSLGQGLPWEAQRLRGYHRGFRQQDLEFDPAWVVGGDGSPIDAESCAEAVRNLVKGPDRITAMVCSADHIAYDLMRRLSDFGISVPGDLSLTGYDGMRAPGGATNITTVRVPYEELGLTAVRRLQHRVDDPTSIHRDILLRHELVIGHSTAPPKILRHK